jgi:hypothetical protein
MTCSGIDIDEDFSPFNLPPIPIQDSKEIWNADQKANWNGRVVQILNPVKRTLQTVIDFLSHPIQEKPHIPFEACIIEAVDALEEEGSDWSFAPAQELLSTQLTEDMTLEQFLEQTGMTFDRELGHVINCKSWLEKKLHSAEKHLRRAAHSTEKRIRKTAKKVEKKVREIAHSTEKNIRKVAHSAEKNIRETAKKTEKFVREHKKEVIIAVVAVAVVIVVLQIPGAAQAIQTAVAALLAKLLPDILNSPRKEGELATVNSLPERSASPPQGHNPQTDHFMRQVFGDLLPSKPTPPPNHGIYTLDAEQKRARESAQRSIYPPSFKAPRPSYTPPSPNSNFVQQFYDNLFKADPQLNPHKHIGKMQPPEKSRLTAPPAEELLSVPKPGPTPSAPSPFKSDFGTYLENLHRGQIASANASSSQGQNYSILPNPSSSVAEAVEPVKGGFTRFLEIVRQGLETIGRMSGPEVDSLDVFNEQATDQNSSEGRLIETPEMDKTSASNSVDEMQNTSNFFATMAQTLRNSMETIGRGMCEPELLAVDSPLDPLKNTVESVAERPNSESLFKKAAETICRGFEAVGQVMNDPRLASSGLMNTQNEFPLKSVIAHFLETITKYQDSISPESIDPLVMYPRINAEQSRYYKIEGFDIPGMRITNINGMGNTFEFAKRNAEHIQSLMPNKMSIHGIYNQNNGILGIPIFDLIEIGALNYPGCSPITAQLLIDEWTEFHERNKDNPYAKLFHECHSQGAIHTRNALRQLPEEIRKRIIVLALAPAVVVPRELCYASYNYASKQDCIPLGQIAFEVFVGAIRGNSMDDNERAAWLNRVVEEQQQIIWLEPHKDAGLFDLDHACQSPTFMPVIKKHLEDYFMCNGDYR